MTPVEFATGPDPIRGRIQLVSNAGIVYGDYTEDDDDDDDDDEV